MHANSYPLLAMAPIAGLAINCLTHLIAARPLGRKSPYPPLMLGAVCGLLAAASVSLFVIIRDAVGMRDALPLLALNGVAYLGLAFCYFNFVNLTVASLRIRLLEELLDSPTPLAKASLLKRYDTSSVIDLRIDRLIRGGHLVESNGRLRSGKLRFLLVARIFDLLRWIILGQKYCSALRMKKTSVPRESKETS